MADSSMKWFVKRGSMIVAIAIALVTGCDSGVSPPDPEVASVDVTLGTPTVGVSESTRAHARARDAGGRSLSQATITWKSSNPGIATVSGDGVVTGVAEGTAAISATSGSASGTAQLQVVNTLPNVRVDFAYLVQVIQNPTGNIPLFQDGNPVLVRVFGAVDRPFPPSFTIPLVRITMYHGDNVVAVDERPMTGSPSTTVLAVHEVVLPASLVQPGLRFRVDINRDSLLSEQTLSDNTFPRDGVPFEVDVRRLQPLRLHFVPLVMYPFPDGTVTPPELSNYLGAVQQLHPSSGFAASVANPLTVTWRGGFGQDAAMADVLGQLDVVRLVEGSTSYYVGVYGGGTSWGGYAFITSDPANFGPGTHVSLIRSQVTSVIAHELGHNMGRWHAPCATPALQLDPSYPNAGGVTNITGADLQRWSVDGTFPVERPGTMFDFMSYCLPRWVSEYTFNALLDWRTREDAALTGMAHVAAQRSLIVWGSIEGDSIRLEPSFIAPVRPNVAVKAGAFTIDVVDAQGMRLLSQSFDPALVDHSSAQRFLVAVPITSIQESALARLTVSGRGMVARRQASPAALSVRTDGGTLPVTFAEVVGGRSLVTWDTAAHPLIIARSAGDGNVLGIGTSGRMELATTTDQVELILSNGLSSVVRIAKRK